MNFSNFFRLYLKRLNGGCGWDEPHSGRYDTKSCGFVEKITILLGEVVEEFETAEIEEIEENEKPAVEPAVEEEPVNSTGAGDTGKQSRAQKKVMKAMAKLNLKKVPGIMKVVLRNGKKGMGTFSIPGGEVYKVNLYWLKLDLDWP